MRILLLSPVPPPPDAAAPRGRESHLAAALRALGHTVDEFLPSPLRADPADPLGTSAAVRRQAQRWLEGRRGDVAVFSGVAEGIVAAAWAREQGGATLWDVAGFPSIDLPARHPEILRRPGRVEALIRDERALFESADVLVAPSRTAALHLLRAGVEEARVVVVPDAVDTEMFRPSSVASRSSDGTRRRGKTTGSSRTRTGHTSTGTTGSAGRRRVPLRVVCRAERLPSQALVPLLQALATAGRHARVDLLVVAPPRTGWRGQFRSLARRLGVDARVRVATVQEPAAVVPLLAVVDACVAPHADDGSSAVAGRCPSEVLEAMSSGLPLLSTRIPLVEELVEHGVSAHLVEPGSSSALADGFVWMAEHPFERASLAARARAAVISQFTPTKFRERIADALAAAAARRSARNATGT